MLTQGLFHRPSLKGAKMEPCVGKLTSKNVKKQNPVTRERLWRSSEQLFLSGRYRIFFEHYCEQVSRRVSRIERVAQEGQNGANNWFYYYKFHLWSCDAIFAKNHQKWNPVTRRRRWVDLRPVQEGPRKWLKPRSRLGIFSRSTCQSVKNVPCFTVSRLSLSYWIGLVWRIMRG